MEGSRIEGMSKKKVEGRKRNKWKEGRKGYLLVHIEY